MGAGVRAHMSFAPAGGVPTNAREYPADVEEVAKAYQGAEATGTPVKGEPERMHMKAYQRRGHINMLWQRRLFRDNKRISQRRVSFLGYTGGRKTGDLTFQLQEKKLSSRIFTTSGFPILPSITIGRT